MTTKSDVPAGIASAVRASWLPMLIIALAQIQMGFNVSALPVSIGGIVEDFNTSPSSVSTALLSTRWLSPDLSCWAPSLAS